MNYYLHFSRSPDVTPGGVSLFADGIASYKVMVIACLVFCEDDFVLALGKETDKSGTRSMKDEYLSWRKDVATDSGGRYLSG